jgi:hypothetical protein
VRLENALEFPEESIDGMEPAILSRQEESGLGPGQYSTLIILTFTPHNLVLQPCDTLAEGNESNDVFEFEELPMVP